MQIICFFRALKLPATSVLCCCLLFLGLQSSGQNSQIQPGGAKKPHGLPIQIHPSHSDGKLDAFVVTRNGKSVTYLRGGVTFSQGNANMTSDSAHFYSEQNSLEAFGHVVIHQADTITITGDRLYYDGNTRLAQMFDHCVMTDRQGVLTTDRLNYDLGTKIGTYFNGGRIVNKDNILVSRTGYYYENTKVCYFKSDVSILTPQTTIKSDTLQYNTVSRIAYFFGPTRIQSRDDFIYCENGQYNTSNDQASFRQHAYYLNGSKKLVGDSLYYDKRNGFGRAIGHVISTDSTDNAIIKGGLAQFNKENEETYVTRKPLFILLTTSNDSAKSIKPLVDSSGNAGKRTRNGKLKERTPTYAEILEGKSEETAPGQSGSGPAHAPVPDFSRKKAVLKLKQPVVLKERIDSLFLTADTLKTILLTGERARPHLAPKIPLKVRNRPFAHDSLGRKAEQLLQLIKNAVIEDSIRLKSGNQPVVIHRNVKSSNVPGMQRQRQAEDSTKIKALIKLNSPVVKKEQKPGFFARLFGRKAKVVARTDTVARVQKKVSARQLDSLKTQLALLRGKFTIPDLLFYTPGRLKMKVGKPFTFADTTHFRVIFAYHHAKLFKSDFQAAADSLVYTYVDSTIRCFKNPALWTQGTQMTGDTIAVRMKDRKIDSLIMTHSSFIISRVDSLQNKGKFNQISGRDMFGKFSNNRLQRMRVEGNGKSLYYATEEKPDTLTRKRISKISGLNSEISSYFLMKFKDNKAEQFTAIDDPQGHFYPVSKIQAGMERLKGFYWRESERPHSKAELFLKPGKAEVYEDSVANKRASKADSTSDEYSENILEVPKPKLKKALKGKAARTLLKPDTQLLKQPIDQAPQTDKGQAPIQFVPPTDSTLSREGVGDTSRRSRARSR